MGVGALNRLDELVDDEFVGRQIGIAHAEVDDVGARGARLCLQTVDLFENIGRQTPDLVKFFHLEPPGIQKRRHHAANHALRPNGSKRKGKNLSADRS